MEKLVKYPRTPHLPWSPGMTDKDKRISTLEDLAGYDVSVTVKWDGESTTMYRDYIHARSLDYKGHPSRDWVKNLWANKVSYQIPEGMRIVGENLYAKHAIKYDDLESYFYGLSVWQDDKCLEFWEGREIMGDLGLTPVPILYNQTFNTKDLKDIGTSTDWSETEGYVVRRMDEFTIDQFDTHVAKYVRKDHVQSSVHNWWAQEVEKNGL